MLRIVGGVRPAGFRFDNANTNYDHTNTNVRPHLCNKKNSNTDLANKAKNSDKLIKALVVLNKRMAATF